MDDQERADAFYAHVMGGGKVEADDWMPADYRAAVLKFVEMHANSELMGVLPEREWILRAPTRKRKLALTSKVQDEVGHAQLLYRVAEDLGKPREQMLADLIWKSKAKGNEQLRQEFLSIYVPRIRELGLTVPDAGLGYDEVEGRWHYTEPDWAELRNVVTGHGPMSQERLEFRRTNHAATQWVRDAVLGAPSAAA